MKKSILVLAIGTILSTGVNAVESVVNGPMAFNPISKSVDIGTLPASEPFAIPEGYSQKVISDERGTASLDIYPQVPDWPDMNTVNETKSDTGRYLYRTHEVRASVFGGQKKFKAAGGAAVSVIDLKTGKTKVLVQREDWEELDGLVWTPWHTLLFAEEANSFSKPPLSDPDVANATEGLLYEINLVNGDPSTAKSVAVRPLLGSLSHEGIEVDVDGNVYVIDENTKGSIYKFVPENYGDLSKGQLYALKVDDSATNNGIGPAKWLKLNMSQVIITARIAARAVNATQYRRPEDLERIENKLYVAITGENRVLAIDLEGEPKVTEFVIAGVNVPIEKKGLTGFKNPDNLAKGPAGQLWIVEDNKPSDIWVAMPDLNGDGYADGVHLFASLSTPGAEATGIYFGTDPQTLFVNIQHTDDGNDKTMAIRKKK